MTLQPKGATAYGTAQLKEGTMVSKLFRLRTTQMDADHTDFTLMSTKYNDVAFTAKNMRSFIDYEEHTGRFTAPDSLRQTFLPALGFSAWVDQYTWNWDHQFLALDNSKSMETQGTEALTLHERSKRLDRMPGALFQSTTPALHDIRFHAINSTYQYDNLELSNHNVYALPVADALIAPGGDSLHISKGGLFAPIADGQLLFPRDSGFHLFYKCDLLVENGLKYSGKGTIDYIGVDEKKQPVYMTQIAPDAQGISVAQGLIADTANFTLSTAFGFAGTMRVDAAHRFYHFDGGVRLLHKCAPVDQLALLAALLYNLAMVHNALGDDGRAAKELVKAQKLYERLVKKDELRYGAMLINAVDATAQVMKSRDKQMAVFNYYRDVAERYAGSLDNAANTAADIHHALDNLVSTLGHEGDIMLNLGYHREAMRFFSRALRHLKRLNGGTMDKRTLRLSIGLASSLIHIHGRQETGEKLLVKLQPTAERLKDKDGATRIAVLLDSMNRNTSIMTMLKGLS